MVDVNEELKFFCENSKKNFFFLGGGGVGGLGRGGGWGSGRGGVRVDVNEELKFFFLENSQKKNRGGVWRGGVRWGVGLVGGGGVRVDVNAMLGVGGDVGYGVCEPRIEVLYNVQKGIVQY